MADRKLPVLVIVVQVVLIVIYAFLIDYEHHDNLKEENKEAKLGHSYAYFQV